MGSVKSGIYSVCVAAACGYLGGKFLKRSNKKIEVNKHHLKSKSLPKAFDGFKIAQVSDLQSQEFELDQRNLSYRHGMWDSDLSWWDMRDSG